jgi:hypothetical protein
MEMYAFIARLAYRKKGTTASGMFSQAGCRPSKSAPNPSIAMDLADALTTLTTVLLW